MGTVFLRVAALSAALALLPCAAHAQIFWDPGASSFTDNTALCVGGSSGGGANQIAQGSGSDCGSTSFISVGGTHSIVLGGANTITLQGSPTGGDIIVGNGTHNTVLDGGTGDVRVGGQLSIQLGGSVDMGGVVVHNVGTPVNGTDAANKAYVDTAVANARTVTNVFGDTASLTADVGNGFAGIKATSGTDSRSASLSAPGLTLNNGTVNTVVLDSQTGNGSFSGNVNVGGSLTVTGVTNLNGGLNVTGGSTLNGGATVNGPTQFNGSVAVAAGNNIDMGGNQIHNVAAGVAPADAVNVSQLNSSVSTLNQRIDSANQRIDKANEGIAIAMAVQNPVLTGGDRFGVAVNFGDFAGNNAVGAAAVGILNQNFFGGGEKFGVTGGFGVSNSEVAGRVGVQLTW